MSIISWIEALPSKIVTFVKAEVGKVSGVSTDVESKLESVSTVADNAVNALKNYVASPQAQPILAVIEAIPGVGPYVQDLIIFLPQLVQDLGWAKAEFTKSPADILKEGIANAVNTPNANVKATNLITLQAHINTALSGLSIQGSTTQAAAVHDGGSVEAEVAPTTA